MTGHHAAVPQAPAPAAQPDQPVLSLDLLTGRARPVSGRRHAEQVPLAVDAETARRLAEVSQEHGVAPFTVLLAVGKLLLGRYVGARDVTVGTPVAGALAVLRTSWADDETAAELFARVGAALRTASADAGVPLGGADEGPGPQPAAGQAAPCPVVFAQGVVSAAGDASPDLTVCWDESAATGLSGVLGYDPDLFDLATARRFAGHYLNLLGHALAEPGTRVAALVHTCAEERALLTQWGTGESVAGAPGVPEAFLARAGASPEAVALEYDGDILTYAQLRDRADALAAVLHAQGVTRGSVVGLAMAPSAQLVVAMLAVLAAGAAYLPLDPAHPRTRRAFMLRDSGARLLIADGAVDFADDLPVLRLDRPVPPAVRDAAAPAHPAELACVLYTSGSTGRPKGVGITHGGIIRLVHDAGYLRVGPGDVVAQVANVSFDAATFEVWGALLSGARLVGIAKDDALTPARLGERLADHGVSTMFLTTALFHRCVDADPTIFAPLRTLFFGGEAADARRVAALRTALPGLRLVNGYGPTEGTTFASTWDVTELPEGAARTPIGRPIGGTRLHVLDDHGRQSGIGVPGELHLGGPGLARGYLGRPDLTAERFVPSPFEPGERLYRTGDVVRWREDGQLEYLGRADHQLKIRGVRIEPDEIASVLATCPGVRAAAVDVRGDGDRRYLVAYVVSAGQVTAAEMRAHLAAQLPAAMVPAFYVPLETLPVTPNGKLDRAALPEPAAHHGARAAGGPPPRGPVEELVAEVWQELLGVPVASAADDFFALGGHSLLAAQMVRRVAARAGVDLGVRVAFEAPTVAAFAVRVAAARPAVAHLPIPAAGDGPHPLSYGQQRLWFLDQLAPGGRCTRCSWCSPSTGRSTSPSSTQELQALVRRHAALRTRLVTLDGEPRQIVDDAPSSVLVVDDLRGCADQDGGPTPWCARTPTSPSTLPSGPWPVAPGPAHRSALSAAGDGAPRALRRRLGQRADPRPRSALRGLATGAPAPPPLTVGYADYTRWQRELLAGETRAAQLAYWVDRLAGAPAALDLATGRPRPAVTRHAGRCSASGCPPRWSGGSTRWAGGTAPAGSWFCSPSSSGAGPVRGRPRRQRRQSGRRTYPPRVRRRGRLLRQHGRPARRWRDTDTFGELLTRARDAVLGAYEHQDVPFEQVVEAVRPSRDASRSPLFQVMLSAQSVPERTDALPGLSVAVAESTGRVAKFDLTVAWDETPTVEGDLRGTVEYDVDLFDRETVERLARVTTPCSRPRWPRRAPRWQPWICSPNPSRSRRPPLLRGAGRRDAARSGRRCGGLLARSPRRRPG